MQQGSRCNEDQDAMRIRMQQGSRCNEVQDCQEESCGGRVGEEEDGCEGGGRDLSSVLTVSNCKRNLKVHLARTCEFTD